MSMELDLENDQSIIDNTKLVPVGKGYYTMHVELPDGHKIEHTELTLEEARKVMRNWCEYVRTEWRGREAAEQERITANIAAKAREREAAKAAEISPEREAELRSKLPVSERQRDEERAGNRLVKPKPRPESSSQTAAASPSSPANTGVTPHYPAGAGEPVYVREQTDPLAYAKAQYAYWAEEEMKLEHARNLRRKWGRVLAMLRDTKEDDEETEE